MKPDSLDTWYTVAEVARRLKVDPSTVYDLLRTGLLRSHRVGPRRGRHRISAAQFAAYLVACESRPPVPGATSSSTTPARVAAGPSTRELAKTLLDQVRDGTSGAGRT